MVEQEHYNPPGELAIKDCALVAIATGRRARDLRELRDGILEADPASIYYHFWGGLLRSTFDDPRYYNGFAIWVDHALHVSSLAERLSVIDPTDFDDMNDLRKRLITVIDSGLELGESRQEAPEDNLFDFIRSQIVVFNTRNPLADPAEFPSAVAAMSRTSVFYHFIDARRRTPDSTDDFTCWLNDIDRHGYAELTMRLASIDPFFATLVETREELTRTFSDHFTR